VPVGSAAAARDDRPEHEPEESASGHATPQHGAILATTRARSNYPLGPVEQIGYRL
jgi:hypothetical protein